MSPLLIYFSFFVYLLSSFNVGVAIAGESSGESAVGREPFHAEGVSDSLLEETDLQRLAETMVPPQQGLPNERRGIGDFFQTSGPERAFHAPPRLLLLGSAAVLPRFIAESRKTRPKRQFRRLQRQELHQLWHGSTRRGRLVSRTTQMGRISQSTPSAATAATRSATGTSFPTYAPDTNVADQRFNTYGTGATGGTGEFKAYAKAINVPHLGFTTYSTEVNGRQQSFSSYSDDANAGDQSFASYGRNGNGAGNGFSSYGKSSNVIGSNFNNYGETGNGANDTFTSYGFDGNVPQNNFKNYGDGGNAAIDSFSSYRDQSNVGDDSFQSYAKNSNAAKVNFLNYGQSFNEGTDKFTGYGSGASGQAIGFKIYGVNNTFKDYAKKGISFSKYMNDSSAKTSSMADSGKKVNRWVEPGKFFREKMLKVGTVMPMPDIRDKMPKRSFLPRVITSKLPFSTSKLSEMKKIFHADDNSSMETIMTEALSDCERAPSDGETKRCVASGEDLIDFATSILGRNVVVRTTQNTDGSKNNVMIGSVKGINGGKVTKSVSCHQSLFPYLLYYCHSVPKVRVYEAGSSEPKNEGQNQSRRCHLSH
ncbi:polygalacturonase 2 [Actinidia rufa]|uniref:Polygalacturonase 2 n=1 Tax=Actinidia rufa TaxID=165716 RepID=A0A7J0EXD0_9ERIC|nr:polygalacturonase 2 [Actinidia rufa]